VDDIAEGKVTDLVTLIASAVKQFGVNVMEKDGQFVLIPQRSEARRGHGELTAIQAEINDANGWDSAETTRLSEQNYVLALRNYSDSIMWAAERVRRLADMLAQLYAWEATTTVSCNIKDSLIKDLVEAIDFGGGVQNRKLPVKQTGEEYRQEVIAYLDRKFIGVQSDINSSATRERLRADTAEQMQEVLRSLARPSSAQ
jgi:hypothetical protein